MVDMVVLGIDLGTSRSAAAAMIDGKITDDERSIILNIGHNVEKYISVAKKLPDAYWLG